MLNGLIFTCNILMNAAYPLFVQNEGNQMKLNAENGVEILTKLMQDNADAPDDEYYGSQMTNYGYTQLLKKLIGHVVDPYHQLGVSIYFFAKPPVRF